MLKIRLQRTGRVHEPTFRIVLTDSKNSTKSGRFLDVLGNFDPRPKGGFAVEGEKVKHWISKGVKLSDTVHNLLITKGIIEGKKITVIRTKKADVVPEDKAEKKADVAEVKDVPAAAAEEKTVAPEMAVEVATEAKA